MALVNPNIAMSFRQPEIQAPNALAQYAQLQQIQAGRQAQELNALKMQEAQAAFEERNALRQLNPSAEDYENQLFKVNPQLGIQFRKEAATTAAQRAAQKKSEFDLKAAQRKFGDDLKRGLSANPSDANIIAFGEDAVLQGLYTQEQVNATVSELLKLSPADRVRVLSQSGASAGELKPTTQVINRNGQTDIVQIPAFSSTPATVGTYADVPLPAAVVAQKKEIGRASAPVSNINVSTEKKYGEQFAGKMADVDIGKMTAAEKAPELAANANRVLDILGQGKAFTGSAADIKLSLAKALNVVGANNDETIANTELLISGLARNTLGAVKSSGLGTGQGFTDKDLKFLQDVEGGRITLNAVTLKNLAELSHKAAEGSANAWNKRSKQLPQSAVEGTGLSIEPVQIPPRSSGVAIPAAAISALKSGKGTDEQFDAIFGAGAAKRVRGQ